MAEYVFQEPTEMDEVFTKQAIISTISISLSHGMMHAYLIILPALLPLIRKEIGDYLILGMIIAMVSIIYGWGSLPTGILADKTSKKSLVTACMVICGLSSIFIGFANGLVFIVLSFILMGIGTSLLHPAAYSIISLLSSRSRGRFMGIFGLSGNIGMAIGFLVSVVIAAILGWRLTFITWGLVGLAVAAVDLFTISGKECRESRRESYPISIKNMYARENVYLYFLVFVLVACSGALWNGVSAFIVSYIKEVKNTELILAGGLATVSYVIGSIAQFVGGEISDRIGRSIVMLLGFFSFFIASLIFTLPMVRAPVLLAIVVSFMGFTFFITQPSLNALIADMSPSDSRGLVYGAEFMIKYGIGGVSPALAGFLAVMYSMNSIFYFLCGISILSTAISLILRFKLKRSGIRLY